MHRGFLDGAETDIYAPELADFLVSRLCFHGGGSVVVTNAAIGEFHGGVASKKIKRLIPNIGARSFGGISPYFRLSLIRMRRAREMNEFRFTSVYYATVLSCVKAAAIMIEFFTVAKSLIYQRIEVILKRS